MSSSEYHNIYPKIPKCLLSSFLTFLLFMQKYGIGIKGSEEVITFFESDS